MTKLIKVQIKKVKGNVVITDKNVYTISKFARHIPELREGYEYEVEVDDKNFLYTAKLLNGDKKIDGLIIIDFETSGVDVNKHYPLSLGMIITDNNLQIENVYYTKIYAPQHDYESEALNINNLKIEDGKKVDTVVAELNSIIGDWRKYRLAGWNICFDFMFLKKMFKMADKKINVNYNLVDIQTLFSFYYYKQTGIWSIKSMRDAYKFLFKSELPQSHNAIEDCLFELKILRYIMLNFS